MKNELKYMLSKNSNEVVGHYKDSHALHQRVNCWAFVEKKTSDPHNAHGEYIGWKIP